MAHKFTELRDGKIDIELVRGDTLILTLNLEKDEEGYEAEEGDTITFTVRKNYKSLTNDEILIQKTVDLFSDNKLHIEPEDTNELDYGSYKYDFQFDSATRLVDTVLQGTFKLTKEVT